MTETNSRAQMLARIRSSLKRGVLDEDTRQRLSARLNDPPSGTVPQRGHGDLAHRVAIFISQVKRVQTTVERVAKGDDVPAAVQRKLESATLPLILRAAQDALVTRLPWSRAPALALTAGRAEATDRASVVGAFAGIAETGTLFLYSAPEMPSSLNFVPELHIVLLETARVLASYEEAFDALRAARKGNNLGLPRTINLITGPSRTGDIERTIAVGAHGPCMLHVILIDEA